MPERGPAGGTPAWLTASGLALLVLVVLAVGMFLTGASPGGLVGHAPPAGGH